MSSNKTIFLIENDDFYIEVIETFVKLFLQQQLVSVKDVREAYARIQAEKPDLILIDLEADCHDALELAEKLRDDAATKRVPIIAVSHNKARSDDALGRGCAAFLTKPFKVRELEALITTLLETA